MSRLVLTPFHSGYNEVLPTGHRFGDVLCAIADVSWNRSTLCENRGLHWADKRFSMQSGIQFVKGLPVCSISEISENSKACRDAVWGRGDNCKTFISSKQYKRNLMIRCLRGQILNPALRKDRFFQRHAERIRRYSLSRNSTRFIKAALHPHNYEAMRSIILFG